MSENLPETTNQNQMLPTTARGADQARAIAEVQAAIIVAKAHPRDEIFCHTQIMKSCERKSLAEKAIYAYRRGSTLVSGPSIALAETIARHWGNINYGFRELSRESGYSEVESFAHDVQTNTRVSRTFTVKHWRDTKQGGYALKEERDIYELVANMAQRRVRACLLEIVPRDIVDDAEQACNKTLVSDDKPLDQQIKDMLIAFDGFGITQENIEEMFQRSIKSIIPADIVKLKQIYTYIKNGVARRYDVFDRSQDVGDHLNDLISKPAPAKEEESLGKPDGPTSIKSSESGGESNSSDTKTDQDSRSSSQTSDTAEDDGHGIPGELTPAGKDLAALQKATSGHQDHPFNRTKWISMRSAGALQIFVKNHASAWETTTDETKVEFYDKWKRILKAGAVEAWPFENMEEAPEQKEDDDGGQTAKPHEVAASIYLGNFKLFTTKETLEEYFKDNNTSILNHSEKDRIIPEYDKRMDAFENGGETLEPKTAQDFIKIIYHAETTGALSGLGMRYAETIDALPESKEIWSRLDEKTAELNKGDKS